MNFCEAIKNSNIVRRPTPKFVGLSGDGWVDARYALKILITYDDLLADDWESKVPAEPTINERLHEMRCTVMKELEYESDFPYRMRLWEMEKTLRVFIEILGGDDSESRRKALKILSEEVKYGD